MTTRVTTTRCDPPLGSAGRAAAGLLTVLALAAAAPACRPSTAGDAGARSRAVDDQHRTWRDYGGGPDSSKYVALTGIDRSNVGRLEVAWSYTTGDDRPYQFNPVVAHGVMYVLAKHGSLVALDAATGEELWIHANLRGIARRGVNYWESEDGRDRRLLFQINNYLQAIDARTGESILSFGRNGLVDLREGLDRDPETLTRAQSNTPGRIFENLILMGSATGEHYLATPGHLRAYDVVTGELVWTFRTIPHPGEPGYETWPPDAWQYAGGANTWGEISVDVERGIAYFPTGSPTYDFYGADRIGENLFANSLLALDARTGRRLWHFQAVHHDLWDYDLTAAPQLVTVRRDGRSIDAVAVAAKHGFLFVFDRVTGEPIFPIEERPVPPSDIPGEEAWPTQPFPVDLPPFARQILTEDDLTPYFLTDAERADWRARVARARKGLFTPPSTEETVVVPGAVGGANWGNTAANPDEGLVYVLSQDYPSFYQLSPDPPGRSGPPPGARGAGQPGGAEYERLCQACHGTAGAGSAAGPALTGVDAMLPFEEFLQVVRAGRGKMPSFTAIDDEAMEALYAFLTGRRGPRPGGADDDAEPVIEGPVVASGGAPGGLEPRTVTAPFSPAGLPYPEGLDVPDRRYYSGWGLGHPYLMRPPWSRIVAYDLNAGTIAWERPLGQDRHAAAEGGVDTGVPRGSQRQGLIVTATGLVFSTARDGRVRAFDADTGEELWSAELPRGTEAIPAMYEVDGRQFLVVCATTPLSWGLESRGGESPPAPDTAEAPPGAYVAFALPETAPETR